jgi:hypothetical protein
MSRKIDWTPLGHAALALVMQALVGGVLALMFYSRNSDWPVFQSCWLLGALFASAFYYGREVTQRQAVIAADRGISVPAAWRYGWIPFRWHWASQADLYAPVFMTHLAVWLIGRVT